MKTKQKKQSKNTSVSVRASSTGTGYGDGLAIASNLFGLNLEMFSIKTLSVRPQALSSENIKSNTAWV